MNYGYFDDKNREYVITRPDTPAPWANYLGSPEYGAIISNNAGGYSFVKSGANGRIIRYRFNSVQADQPGRFIYLKDRDKNDYWSASWQPVGKDLKSYQSECRHGTSYTEISAKYDGISSKALYYVPLGSTYEVWRLRVQNESDVKRSLSVTGFVEFTTDSNYEQDTVNLQYTQFITRTYFEGNFIRETMNENVQDECDNKSGKNERFFGLAGEKVAAYCGDREVFVGPYRGYANPEAIETGCNNALNYNGNPCGALQADITLEPGESKELIFLLGEHRSDEAKEIIAGYEKDKTKVDRELAELKTNWHGKLDRLSIKTPDPAFDSMVNTWNAFQCFITFTWSRAASFIYCGLRNGYGYRDTVQDIQGIMHLDPELACEKLRFMLSAQVSNGGGLPLVKYTHNAGHENTPDDPDYVRETGHPSYRADDALWLFPTVEKYINESGNLAFLDEKIFFADGGEGSVYEHLKRAIRFSMEHLGDHGMPAGLHADWNDCLRLGKKGESVFVAFQLYYAMKILRNYAENKNDQEYIEYLDKSLATLRETITQNCWEGDRFIRGIREDGIVVGSKRDPEASMWLNPQSWAVISGFAEGEQAKTILESVHRELNTEFGAMLFYPPYRKHAFDGALMQLFNAGTKENAGIFSQPQGWLVLAEALAGNGDRAFEYYRECSPACMNDRAEIRKLEPYAHGQFIEGKDSPFAGRANVHWLTGTASTVMVGCVEGILGLHPQTDGLIVDPCIPSSWDGLEIQKEFRGKRLNITVLNGSHVQKGIKGVTLNGLKLEGKLIPFDKMKEENEVIIRMG